ncbi:hypothetical protein KEM56_002493 [Ascosphaera pollenicola]|nr:hypothetical protein KEM56_002493 [Ascosphaera pollenicola]
MNRNSKLGPDANRILFVKNLRYRHHRRAARCTPAQGHEEHTTDLPIRAAFSYNVGTEDLFDLFGKFGPIRCVLSTLFIHVAKLRAVADKFRAPHRQIRQGVSNNTKGTAFVVYEETNDAKQACDKLNGFNFQNRYLVVLYHQPEKITRSKEDLIARKTNLEQLKQQHGIE